jgi:hypothetical protein
MTGLGWVWALAVAWGQAAPTEEGPGPGWTEIPASEAPSGEAAPVEAGDEDAPDFEVVIVGEHVVSERRAAIVRRFESLGWVARERADGAVVFRPPRAWMGRARLFDTGELTFASPVVALMDTQQQPSNAYDPQLATSGFRQTQTVNAELSLPSPAAQRAIHAEVRAAVAPELAAYQDALRLRGFGRYLDALPDRLAALWQDGVGLDRAAVPEIADRRAALLDFWATRTDTPEGRATSRVVEAFLRNVVQTSASPIPAAEATEAEARRADGRTLDL